MFMRKKTGQSTAEYAIVIGLVIAAAVAMQVYVKRGIQAKIKGTVDFVPEEAASVLSGKQYEPYYAHSNMETTMTANVETASNKGGEVVRDIVEPEVTKTWGSQKTTGIE